MTTERARARRRPGPAPVIWGSIALFGVLFALLTYRLTAGPPANPRPVAVRKVVKRRIVTTVVPLPGPDSVSSAAAVTSESGPVAAAPITTGAS